MPELLLLADLTVKPFYLLPLIVSVSLVYAATRHEWMGPIVWHAFRFVAGWITGFLAILFLILYWVSSRL
jgi:hypothetical protein